MLGEASRLLESPTIWGSWDLLRGSYGALGHTRGSCLVFPPLSLDRAGLLQLRWGGEGPFSLRTSDKEVKSGIFNLVWVYNKDKVQCWLSLSEDTG